MTPWITRTYDLHNLALQRTGDTAPPTVGGNLAFGLRQVSKGRTWQTPPINMRTLHCQPCPVSPYVGKLANLTGRDKNQDDNVIVMMMLHDGAQDNIHYSHMGDCILPKPKLLCSK